MAAAGVAQYLLFLRNAEGSNIVTLLLQSVAMQFCLTADSKFMTPARSNYTHTMVSKLIEYHKNLAKDETIEDAEESAVPLNREILWRAKLMYVAESSFLVLLSTTGFLWSIGLGYCM